MEKHQHWDFTGLMRAPRRPFQIVWELWLIKQGIGLSLFAPPEEDEQRNQAD